MPEQISTAAQAKAALKKRSSKRDAQIAQRFFKTGPGEYGEGDIFIGVRVPATRQVARLAREMPLQEIQKLVKSPVHEERLLGFILCAEQVKIARKQKDHQGELRIVDFYITNRRYLNNWDLVDVTTPQVLGPYFFERQRKILYNWIKSKSLWERRMAILTTQDFIRRRDYADTLKLCQAVLDDEHDLIHKASGWMLREVGNNDVTLLRKFIAQFGRRMPRTMLRYAIEKLSREERTQILAQTKSPRPSRGGS